VQDYRSVHNRRKSAPSTFGRKWENQWAAAMRWYTDYYLCRLHKSLRVTPAMAAGISGHIWSVRELLEAA
jgi:hypothetical protein